MSVTRLSVIGLGKLGAVMAAILAEKGYSVTGVDLNQDFVDAINRGEAPVEEPDLAALVARNRERLRATADAAAAVLDTEATFIIVPTPSGRDGTFRLDYVLNACRSIGHALRGKPGYHLVVVSSTVMPGHTSGEILPALEQASGKKCGADFGLCYNPEFIALGSVVRDMLNPDMLLIGESDAAAGEMLESIYRRVCENDPPAMRMNFVNAELTKLAVNTYVTTKISYANMLAEVCGNLPGADVDAVTAALGRDTRIGRKYLKGAMGYGGPCFPRDNVAFAAMARQLGVEATLAEATHEINRRQVPRLGEWVLNLLPPGGAAAILGLSYKPGTGVVEESQGVALARFLAGNRVPVRVYDPQAMPAAARELGESVTYAASLDDAIAAADVIVVATPWEQFRALTPPQLARPAERRAILLDCWRIFAGQGFEQTCTYLQPGVGREGSARADLAAARA